jgi:hypothetical protein
MAFFEEATEANDHVTGSLVVSAYFGSDFAYLVEVGRLSLED